MVKSAHKGHRVFTPAAGATRHTHLMNGLVSASRVRMNQEGWTMIKDFRFFRNLRAHRKEVKHQAASSPAD